MKHYGDIKQLHGDEIPVVDVITGGSPCQDLSVAGKRAGLAGERSGLFMEQIRIVKEMREHDRNTGRSGIYVRPRYMVWENVPGALSSNKGADFQAVLTEVVKIVREECPDVPLPKRWDKSGCIMGIGDEGLPFSVAWRVHDGQFWGATQYIDGRMFFPGTPQRRKRIALVADFNGLTAPEILFVRQGLRGNLAEKQGAGETLAGAAPTSLGATNYTLKIRGGRERDSYGKRAGKGALIQTELSGTIGVSQDQTLIQVGTIALEGNGARPSHRGDGYAESDTMFTLNTVEQHAVAVYEQHSQDSRYNPMRGGVSETVSSKYGTGGNNTPIVVDEDICGSTLFQVDRSQDERIPSCKKW